MVRQAVGEWMKREAVVAWLVVGIGVLGIGLWFLLRPTPRRARNTDLPNILLITLDTTRADHLSCYGYERRTSPRLDALAEEGMLYTRCISTSSWTLPAHASLLTGRVPTSHGAMYDPNSTLGLTGILPGDWSNYRVSALGESIPSLAALLKQKGYATGGVIGGPWLKRAFGFGPGFDMYDDAEIDNVNGRLAEQINRRALPWIEQQADDAWFLFINYFDPHDPYYPPEGWRYRFLDESKLVAGAQATPEQLVALYDAEIYYTDHHLGEMIDHLVRLGLYDDTWIIVTADHGELFGEHGLRGHGATLYQEEIHIPLVMKYPRQWPQTGRSDALVQIVDIMPMILQRLGIALPPALQGVPNPDTRRQAFAEVYPLPALSKGGGFRAFIKDKEKFIWNSRGRHALYDLAKDPGELHNRYRLEFARAIALREEMDAMFEILPRPKESVPVRQLDQDTKDALRNLGYVTGTRSTTTGASSAPTTNRARK